MNGALAVLTVAVAVAVAGCGGPNVDNEGEMDSPSAEQTVEPISKSKFREEASSLIGGSSVDPELDAIGEGLCAALTEGSVDSFNEGVDTMAEQGMSASDAERLIAVSMLAFCPAKWSSVPSRLR